MASSSSTTSNLNTTNVAQASKISFSFSTLVKLDRSNFLLWRKQVLTSIKGNQLEEFISNAQIILDQYINQIAYDGSM